MENTWTIFINRFGQQQIYSLYLDKDKWIEMSLSLISNFDQPSVSNKLEKNC